MKENIEQMYAARYDSTLRKLAQNLEELISSYCVELDRVDRITVRAKRVDRFVDKSQKKNCKKELNYTHPLKQIHDQVGARIVTFYKDDIEEIVKIVESYFKPIEQKDLVPDTESSFGYFGKHYILLVPSDALDDGFPKDDIPDFFELQIKTLFQHAWSEANHDLGYKSEVDLTPQQKRKMAYTAAQAWGADEMFSNLVNELSTPAA